MAPLLSDNPTPWACNTTVAGPSTFPGALGHAGGTAGVDHAPPATDQSRRDHVSLAINPGLLYAEQGRFTNEYATTLDNDEWDEEDVTGSDYEEVAEDDRHDTSIAHDIDEPNTYGDDDVRTPSTEDGPITVNDERRSVEFHPTAHPVEGRVTRSPAALSRNASSTKHNDKGKRRASPEPCNKESTQSPTTSGKRKEPSDPRDDKQDVPSRRNYTGGNIGTGNWKCLEPKCTRNYRREADMKRHWQWECVVRNPKLLKVVLCEYCGKRYVRPDVLRVHLRTCKIKKAQEESQAGGSDDGGGGRKGPGGRRVCLPDRVIGTHRIRIASFHPFRSSACLDPTSYELDASRLGERGCGNIFMANDLSCGVRPASSSKYREQGLRSIFERCGRADKNEGFVSRVGDGEDERWRYARCRDHVRYDLASQSYACRPFSPHGTVDSLLDHTKCLRASRGQLRFHDECGAGDIYHPRKRVKYSAATPTGRTPDARCIRVNYTGLNSSPAQIPNLPQHVHLEVAIGGEAADIQKGVAIATSATEHHEIEDNSLLDVVSNVLPAQPREVMTSGQTLSVFVLVNVASDGTR
ncbi:predicted protein [Postia placenta Mad-698-R]|nr:predicted protein [Postia placenta Mad-698-R]